MRNCSVSEPRRSSRKPESCCEKLLTLLFGGLGNRMGSFSYCSLNTTIYAWQKQSKNAKPTFISCTRVDTKKRELVGNFNNAGAKWDRSPVLVNDHDFQPNSIGVAIPYGIYDCWPIAAPSFWGLPRYLCLRRSSHRRLLETGRCSPLPQRSPTLIFVVHPLRRSRRRQVWKTEPHAQLSNPFDPNVTVAHYPTGTSNGIPSNIARFPKSPRMGPPQPLNSYQAIRRFPERHHMFDQIFFVQVFPELPTLAERSVESTNAELKQWPLGSLAASTASFLPRAIRILPGFAPNWRCRRRAGSPAFEVPSSEPATIPVFVKAVNSRRYCFGKFSRHKEEPRSQRNFTSSQQSRRC